MKIVDNKGRLFGRINVIDFFIIVSLVVVLPGFFYIYKVMGQRPVMVPYEKVKVTVVTFTIPEISALFKEGDMSYDEFGNPDGKILKVSREVGSEGEELKSVIMKKGNMPNYDQRIPVTLEMELSCTHSAKGEAYYYKREPLVIGLDSTVSFLSPKYNVTCYVIKIENSEYH